jgi:glutamyl-tRNA synthetase
LFARHEQGTMILRIDDTDVERNSQTSLNSIYDGLGWLGLAWDEFYRQSDRFPLYAQAAEAVLAKGAAYRDFTPASTEERVDGTGWLCNPGMRELSCEESDRRAAAGEPFVVRFRVPRESDRRVAFTDLVYGEQSKAVADMEDFALVRSSGAPTYHHASCVDDADLRISHIIRGQDHLTNTFKHILLFEALGVEPPRFAHLPLLIAPDGAKLSKRKHGPVVSVMTYRDAGFLPAAYINFLCLLGWNPKDDRERMSLEELTSAFSFEGVNRPNAVVNFSEEDPIDPKALWLNSQHLYALSVEALAAQLTPVFEKAGYATTPEKTARVTRLIQERIKTLNDAPAAADFFFVEELAPYDLAELVPKKGDLAMAQSVLEAARPVLERAEFTHDGLESALRDAAAAQGLKAGQMFQPIRVAVCGRKNAPPLFETLEVVGRAACLKRIDQAVELLKAKG